MIQQCFAFLKFKQTQGIYTEGQGRKTRVQKVEEKPSTAEQL